MIIDLMPACSVQNFISGHVTILFPLVIPLTRRDQALPLLFLMIAMYPSPARLVKLVLLDDIAELPAPPNQPTREFPNLLRQTDSSKILMFFKGNTLLKGGAINIIYSARGREVPSLQDASVTLTWEKMYY